MFVKDETTREVPAMEFIKQNDPFMYLKTGAWGLTLDLPNWQASHGCCKGQGGALAFKAKDSENQRGGSCNIKGEGKGSLKG